MHPVTFSLCHTTARLPDGWRKATQTWFDACDNPRDVEHVLVTDCGFTSEVSCFEAIFPRMQWRQNTGRRCAVDGWNTSARFAEGQFLITLADDWFPCPHWDTRIKQLVPDMTNPVVLDVNTGGDHDILTFSMLTRPYLERLIQEYGYEGFFYPEYLGMMADTEFGEIARLDGVVLKAKHLLFPHDHPNYTGKPMDSIHQWQHRREALKTGEEVFLRRMEQLTKRKLPRFIDKPGMPPLNELFGIRWEAGALKHLVEHPEQVIAEETRKYRAAAAIREATYYIGEECEAKTPYGWRPAFVTVCRRDKNDNFTYRVETSNHMEFELRAQDIRRKPQRANAEKAQPTKDSGEEPQQQKSNELILENK